MKKPKLIHVAFDSNILRLDRGFNKPDMLQLAALAKLGLIKVHIPWFVYMECISAYVAEIDAEINRAMASLKDLSKKGLHENDDHTFNHISNKIEKGKRHTKESVEKVWKEFMDSTGSILHPLDPLQTVPVFKGYFSGSAPYSALKKREDIPDAFILESLKAIASSHDLHFICNDKNLRKHADAVDNIAVYITIDAFFKSATLSPAMLYYDTVGKVKLRTMELLALKTEIVDSIAYQIPKWSQFDCYVDYPYANDEFISVNAIDDPKVELDEENIKLIDDVFYIPFTIRGTASIDYFVDISDAMGADEYDRLPPLSSWNEWVMFAEDIDEVNMKGTLELPLSYLEQQEDIHFTPDNIENFLFDKMKEQQAHTWRSPDLEV